MQPQARSVAAPHDAAGNVGLITIQRRTGIRRLNLGEVWEFRELLYYLVWRDVKVRYKQTLIGVAWAVLQPLGTMALFSIFFGRLASMPSDGLPYPVFTLAALVPWTLFAFSINHASMSLVTDANLLKKVYFPRIILPMASLLSGIVDFCVSLGLLIGAMLIYGILPDHRALLLPVFIAMGLAASLGVGLWLSAINAHFRDVRYVLPFLVQAWMFATPVVYPASLVPESWRAVYALNPLVGAIEGFRWSLLGAGTSPDPAWAVSGVVALTLLLSGAVFFRSMERTLADSV